MLKIKLRFLMLLTLFLIMGIFLLNIYRVYSQPLLFEASPSQIIAQETHKSRLARQVLQELGIAKRYDLHFDHLMGALLGQGDDFELYARFRNMFIREVGWEHFEDAYVEKLAANFSEDELNELLKLAHKTVLKKLLMFEIKAYLDTSEQRFRMGFDVWNHYNNGTISLPPN